MTKRPVEGMSEVEKAYMLGCADMMLVNECGLDDLMRQYRQIPSVARVTSRESMKHVESVLGRTGLEALRDVRFDVDR